MSTVDNRTIAEIAADRVAECLIGTARSRAEGMDAAEAPQALLNDKEFCRALDQLCFCCEDCGWWCDTEELRTDGKCEDCDSNPVEDEDGSDD